MVDGMILVIHFGGKIMVLHKKRWGRSSYTSLGFLETGTLCTQNMAILLSPTHKQTGSKHGRQVALSPKGS